MSLVAEIRIEAPQALQTIASVEAGLVKVETAGAKATDTLTKGFGNSSSAAEKAKQASQSLAEQFAKLTSTSSAFSGFEDHFRREADMLEKIHGPAREYAADLQALDMLLQRNAISAGQYADQVTNLNKRIGERPTAAAAMPETPTTSSGGGLQIDGSLASAAAGQFGVLGTSLEGLASKGALEAAAMVGLAAAAVSLGDQYIELSNRALKLTDSYHTVDEVLDEQYASSVKLHGSLDQMMEISTIVKERTDDLGLSQQQLTAFTNELAAGVELSGHSMGDAASVVNRLSFALESGLPAGREMKNILREYPDVAKDLETASGLTGKQLVDMSNKGKLSLETFITSIGGSTVSVQKLGDRVETTGGQWQHFKDGLVLTAGKLVEQSGLVQGLGVLFKTLSDVVDVVTTVLAGVHKELGDTGTVMIALGAAFAVGLGPITALVVGFEALKGAADWLVDSISAEEEARIKVRDVQKAEFDTIIKLNMAMAAEADAADKDFQSHNDLADAIERVTTARAAGSKILDDASAKNIAARQHVDALKASVDEIMAQQDELRKRGVFSFGIDPNSFLTSSQQQIIQDSAKAQRDLNDSENQHGDLLIKIHDKETQRAGDIAGYKALLKSGTITQHEYDEAMKEFAGSMSEMQKIYDDITEPARQFHITQQALNALMLAGRIGWDDYTAAIGRAVKAENEGLEARRGPTPSVTGGHLNTTPVDTTGFSATIAGANKNAEASSLSQQFGNNADIEKYIKDLALLQHGLSDGAISASQFAQYKSKLDEQMGASVDPMEKLNEKQAKLDELYHLSALSAKDYATQSAAVTKEHEKIADSGKDFISGLSRGWHSIRDEVNDTATTIASSMKGAFDAVNSDIVSMVTTGTADWGKLVSSIEADLARIALQKAESAAISFVGGVIAGSWAGSDTTIPHFASGGNAYIHAANGYQGRVGGVGGTDTRLFAAMVSPGETVAIRTPEQMAAQQNNNSTRPVLNITNRNDTRGDLAADFRSGVHDTALVNVMKRIGPQVVQSLIKK